MRDGTRPISNLLTIEPRLDPLNLFNEDKEKVKKYEESLKQEIVENIQQLIELQDEKDFYTINADENEQLINSYYLPNLNNALNDKPRKGIRIVEIKEKGVQCEDEDDNLVDWSGQWSSDE